MNEKTYTMEQVYHALAGLPVRVIVRDGYAYFEEDKTKTTAHYFGKMKLRPKKNEAKPV